MHIAQKKTNIYLLKLKVKKDFFSPNLAYKIGGANATTEKKA